MAARVARPDRHDVAAGLKVDLVPEDPVHEAELVIAARDAHGDRRSGTSTPALAERAWRHHRGDPQPLALEAFED